MERLTARNKDGIAFYPFCYRVGTCNGNGASSKCNQCPFERHITEKLAAYEDTDLTPEQIIELDKLYRQKCEELNREKVRTVELVNTIESLKKVIAATEIQVNKLEHKLRELQKGE